MGANTGNRIELELGVQNRTRAWLAGELGVSRQVLNRWLKGRAPWPKGRKAQVAALLHADEQELFTEG